jgi:ribosomal protein S18 acetylase RimI-like enzyme
VSPLATLRPFEPADLPGVLELCAAEGWPSFPADAGRALRALTAPGVTTIVALEGDKVVAFAQLQSDGEIQAHLSLIAVDSGHRRHGLARALLRLALERAGGRRIDLVTDTAPDFYAALPHRRMQGFRIWPQAEQGSD